VGRPARAAECHPERRHAARGLCKPCYYRRRRWLTRTVRPAREAVDVELGPVRYCAQCQEWWPLDQEFWQVAKRDGGRRVTLVCRACGREAARRYYQRRAARCRCPGT
jgi:hypothetical protein